MLSLTEEDYLKAIYQLSENQEEKGGISTNEIAKKINISAASVSDMIKKLSQKEMVHHMKYKGVTLTEQGRQIAINLVRKHRLWETFLVRKLNFTWDEVHAIAEQLEHIQSPMLIQRLDEFLEFPAYDPHGDPIPNAKGEILQRKKINLQEAPLKQPFKVLAVEEGDPLFLKHLNKLNINIGTVITILDKVEYDESLEIRVDESTTPLMISQKVAQYIFVAEGQR
ncbi:MAG TPA: iron-dependent repressor [Microscillaceae bacterium]|nr:iron-dependent repressor [Microscillaceae bacterium]